MIMAEDQTSPTVATSPSGGPIRDRRPRPPGVMPRHVQMWLMAGIALVIFTIIVFTGRSAPAPRPTAAERPADAPMALTERIRGYRQQLAEDQARQERILAQQKDPPTQSPRPPSPDAAARDAIAEERRRREYQSLFADSVALSRRPPDRQPYGERGRPQSAGASAADFAPSTLSGQPSSGQTREIGRAHV